MVPHVVAAEDGGQQQLRLLQGELLADAEVRTAPERQVRPAAAAGPALGAEPPRIEDLRVVPVATVPVQTVHVDQHPRTDRHGHLAEPDGAPGLPRDRG